MMQPASTKSSKLKSQLKSLREESGSEVSNRNDSFETDTTEGHMLFYSSACWCACTAGHCGGGLIRGVQQGSLQCPADLWGASRDSEKEYFDHSQGQEGLFLEISSPGVSCRNVSCRNAIQECCDDASSSSSDGAY